MKIHLAKHQISEASSVGARDIPLAYVDTKDSTFEAKFRLEKDFATETSTLVRAYHKLPDSSTILFDENAQPIKDASIRRQGAYYIYEPSNAKEFTPANFTAHALIQRRMTYSSSDQYDFKIGVLDPSKELPLCTKLIGIFGDAYRRGDCPPNVRANGGAMTPQTLLNATENDSDFIFVEGDPDKKPHGLNIATVLKKHVNVWVSAESLECLEKADPEIAYQEGILSSAYHPSARELLPERTFNTKKHLDSFPPADYNYSHPYPDVMIVEKPRGGFLIVTPKELLDNCGKNIKLIYDVLLFVFFKSYQESLSAFSWITDEPVDYVAYSQTPLNLHHKTINLEALLYNEGYDLRNQYRLIEVVSSNPGVSFINMAPNKDLFFRKTASTSDADPVKPANAISYLTTKDTVVIYEQDEVYLMTSRVPLTSKTLPGGCCVVVGPVHDSIRCIYSDEPQELIVPNINMVWFVCTKRGNALSTNTFSLVEQGEYSLAKDGYKVAEVRVVPHYDAKLIDVRTPGGGLPAGERDVYNLMDIGNVYGRPYRIGSTLIVRLPLKLRKHKDKIMAAVKKHIAAGEYPVLIFE